MLPRANSFNRIPAKTRYASLAILAEIANELLWPKVWTDKPPGYYRWLAERLQQAQSAADTPESLRVNAASVRLIGDRKSHPSLALGRPFPLPAYWMDAENFDRNASAMASALNSLAENWRQPQPPRMLMVVPLSARVINILNDYTVDFGPELFSDTLMRSMAGRDVRRIRLCSQCRQVFIALNVKSSTCSEPCANLRKVHKFLADNPNYYSRAARKQRARRHARASGRKRTSTSKEQK